MNLEDIAYKQDFRSTEFLDASGEWRRLFAEFFGTFFLVLVSAGIIMVSHEFQQINKSIQVIAPGLIVMVLIYSIGAISGAHINPAVTIAFALRRHFEWKKVPLYVLAQLLGGIFAILLLREIAGNIGNLGATTPYPGYGYLKSFITEVILTIGLINTILCTASGPRNIGHNAALAIGGYIMVAGLWASPLTGASMNIVRTLAPDIVRVNFETTWIYILSSITGAVIAVCIEWILKGKPSIKATQEARGSMNSNDSEN